MIPATLAMAIGAVNVETTLRQELSAVSNPALKRDDYEDLRETAIEKLLVEAPKIAAAKNPEAYARTLARRAIQGAAKKLATQRGREVAL